MTRCASLLPLLAVVLVRIAFAADIAIDTTDAVCTGRWMSSFAAATNLAVTTHTPLVLVWANKSCGECSKLEDAIANTSEFKSWMASNPHYVYCFVRGEKGRDVGVNADSGANAFARSAGGTISDTRKWLGQFPYVCLWWPKGDASSSAWNFCGRTGQMLVRAASGMDTKKLELHDPTMLALLALEFEGSIDKHLGSYSPFPPAPTFSCSGGTGDRLEIERATPCLRVPLTRDGGAADAQTLVVTWPDGRAFSTNVVWSKGQTQAVVAVPLDNMRDNFPEGRKLELVLRTTDGRKLAATSAWFVASPRNSPSNPLWCGERTVDTLGFADWTLDYDVARARLLSGRADYLLAVVDGSLWCPYCAGIERTLFASEAWREWLETNRVQLAMFDQAQTPANGDGAELLSYVGGLDRTNGTMRLSGASYLSRHGLSATDPEVVAVRTRSRHYSWEAWRQPESSAARLSTPSLLLIGRDDAVLGRFRPYSTGDRTDAVFDVAENLARLTDLLRLATRADESGDYVSLTRARLGLDDSADVEFQVNACEACFVLDQPETGTLTVSAEGPRKLDLSYWVDGTRVDSSSEALTVRIKPSHVKAKRLVIKVSAAYPETVGGSSVFKSRIMTSFEPGTGNTEALAYLTMAGELNLMTLDSAGVKRVSVARSGALPAGLSLKYDTKTGRVLLSGTPKKAGQYEFSYSLKVTRTDGRVVLSEPEGVSMTVMDPKTINPHVNMARRQSVPIVDVGEDGRRQVVGVIDVSLSKSGKIVAKHVMAAGKHLSFSGKWQVLDAEERTARAVLTGKGHTLEVSLSDTGVLSVVADGKPGAVGPVVTGSGFDGTYTVTLPLEASSDTTSACQGTSYCSLKIKGDVAKLSGQLLTGETFSLTTRGALDPADSRYMLIPVLRTSSKSVLSLMLRVRRDASRLYVAYHDYARVRVVLQPLGWKSELLAMVGRKETSFVLGVYGGYYQPKMTVADYLSLFRFTQIVPMVYGVEFASKYSVNRTSGILSGTASLDLGGKKVSGTFKGVLLPGWLDCECGVDPEASPEEVSADGSAYVVRPFASGCFYYKTTDGGRSVTASLPLDWHAE